MMIIENLEHMEIVSKRKPTPTIKNNLVNILTYCYCLLLQERKKSCYNSNILIMHNLRSMYM